MNPNIKDINTPEYWNQRYLNNEDHWDLGHPTPVFKELLKSDYISEPGRIAILGCGKGHDAVLFAKNEFLVTAIDFAPLAIKETRKLAKEENVRIELIEANIFELPGKLLQKFDYVLEYVTYCAVEPARRYEYLLNIKHLIKPGGLFIALFFSIDNRSGGPPFAVDIKQVKEILGKKFSLICSETPKSSVGPRQGKEILMIWKKR